MNNNNSIKMIVFGDIMLSRKVGDLIKNNEFSLDTKLIEKIIGNDIVFGNLESILSNKGKLGKCKYCFRANPLAIKILKNILITDVSVVNNHMADYGYDAWYQSVSLLNKSNISTVGNYYNLPDPLIKLINHKIIAIYALKMLNNHIYTNLHLKKINICFNYTSLYLNVSYNF